MGTAPVTHVVVSGCNLADVVFTAKVDGAGEAIHPASHDANGATERVECLPITNHDHPHGADA